MPSCLQHRKAAPESLDSLIGRFAHELIAYQDEAYAARFRLLVERVRLAETLLDVGPARPLTEAVARSLFKLMGYKDEYEVARLYADPAFKAKLASQFGGEGKLKVLLAPPLLSRTDPATGRPRKMSFGPWVFTVFKILAKLKTLRGTRFDPFGWMAERRTERRLVEEYEATVDTLLRSLSPANVEAAAVIAALPMRIAGFGPIKMARIAEVKASEKELLAAFRRRNGQSEPAKPLKLQAAE